MEQTLKFITPCVLIYTSTYNRYSIICLGVCQRLRLSSLLLFSLFNAIRNFSLSFSLTLNNLFPPPCRLRCIIFTNNIILIYPKFVFALPRRPFRHFLVFDPLSVNCILECSVSVCTIFLMYTSSSYLAATKWPVSVATRLSESAIIFVVDPCSLSFLGSEFRSGLSSV